MEDAVVDPAVYSLMRERGQQREDAEVRIQRQVAANEVIPVIGRAQLD